MIEIRQHNATGYVPLDSLYVVDDVRASWRRVGGPYQMTCRVTGAPETHGRLLADAPTWLGQLVRHRISGWHGMVLEVEVQDGFIRTVYSLAEYANRVTVAGETFIAGWQQSAPQQAVYGVWEYVEDVRDITPTAAAALAARLLAARRASIVQVSDLDLDAPAGRATVTVTAIGRLPACARFATNVYRGSNVLGYYALDVVKTTLDADANGAATTLSVADESLFAATNPVAVSLADGTFHVDEVASVASGEIVLTNGLPGAAADVVATRGARVALAHINIGTWLGNLISYTDLTPGVLLSDALDATKVPIATMTETNVWALLEALATYTGANNRELTVDAEGRVHYGPAGDGSVPDYTVTRDGSVFAYNGGPVGAWEVRPGWYHVPAAGRTLLVSEVTLAGGAPKFGVTAMYGEV